MSIDSIDDLLPLNFKRDIGLDFSLEREIIIFIYRLILSYFLDKNILIRF